MSLGLKVLEDKDAFGPWEQLHGRTAILETVREAESPYAMMMHYLHNTHFVGVPDSSAVGEHYDMGGAYSWEFVRTPDGWKGLKQHLSRSWSLGTDTLGAF